MSKGFIRMDAKTMSGPRRGREKGKGKREKGRTEKQDMRCCRVR